MNGKYILERYGREEADNLKNHVSEGNTVQDSRTPVVIVFEFILVVFLGSNDVAMPGETTLLGVTIAHKALSGAAFTSLAETGLACVSILPSQSVHIEIEETKTSKYEFRWIAQLLLYHRSLPTSSHLKHVTMYHTATSSICSQTSNLVPNSFLDCRIYRF